MTGCTVEIIRRAAVISLCDCTRQFQALVRVADGRKMPKLLAHTGRCPQAGFQNGLEVFTADLLGSKRTGGTACVDGGKNFVHR